MRKGTSEATREKVPKTATLILFIANIIVGVYGSSLINILIGLGGLVIVGTHILINKWRRDRDNGICW